LLAIKIRQLPKIVHSRESRDDKQL